ncbi:MAG: serine protease [Burkholderiaceae bacterium]|nr:serine protease [Burkholderiaceae bacterium]
MRNLQDATERICELKGSLVALDALLPAVIDTLSAAGLNRLVASFDAHAEVARTLMLHSEMSDVVLAAFEREVARSGALLHRSLKLAPQTPPMAGMDPLLLTTTQVTSCSGAAVLSEDSGFFFRRNGQLFLVTTRQAMAGRSGSQAPDRLEIKLAVNPQDPSRRTRCSLDLQSGGQRRWRAMSDSTGSIGVAVLKIESADLPESALLLAFDETHLEACGEDIGIGDVVSMVGFPMGLSSCNEPLPIARSGSIASPYGLRFRGRACFLTDMLSREGCCGSPVLRRRTISRSAAAPVGWQLLGVHSSHPVGPEIEQVREPYMALHQAWHSEVLMSLTEDG